MEQPQHLRQHIYRPSVEGETNGAVGFRVAVASDNAGTNLNNVIEDNTIEAIDETTDPSHYAWAVLLEGTDTNANCSPLFLDNVFESNDISLQLGCGDSWSVTDGNFVSDTFSRASDGAPVPYTAIVAGYWIGELQNVTIIDPSYANGATPTITWDVYYPSDNDSDRQLAFGWLLSVGADDANGDPLSGATVDVFDNSGNQVFSGVTDALGQLVGIPLATTIYDQPATDTDTTITTQNCGPFQVQVSLAGYATSTQTINLTQSTTAKFQLTSGTMTTVNAPTNLFGRGRGFAGERESVVDRQRQQRDVLHGGAVGRHDGRLDRHRQRPFGHGHELRGQQRDGRGELQLRGRGV